jgi:transposase
MSADELRDVVQSLLKTVSFKQATIDKLTHENAYLKRLKFAAQSERFSAEQRSLLEETLDEDLQAVNDEIEELSATDAPAPRVKAQPKRQPLPVNLPRVDIQHEPDSTTCACGCQMKRIGEDVSEKLDYTPGVFTVEQHIRGKWACTQCQTLIQHRYRPRSLTKASPLRFAGAGAGGQVQRPFAAVPPGTHFWPCRVWKSHARHWRNGWAFAACNCSHWWMRSRTTSSVTGAACR